MSLNPLDVSRPDSLIPQNASLDAYAKVIARPTLNDISFLRLALNSIVIAVVISLASVSIGAMAAYAFSRLQFRGRQFFMIAILAVLMLPAVATIAPLFVQLNKVVVGPVNLRASLFGVALAVTSSQLPFAVWNIKGYLDTIPRELEEAAAIDGAGRFGTMIRIMLPLTLPGLVTAITFTFIAAWNEYVVALTLIQDEDLKPLTVGVSSYVTQYVQNWAQLFAASLIAIVPVVVLFALIEKHLMGGLTSGAVK
jgi:multiple sugar transport system permease protein